MRESESGTASPNSNGVGDARSYLPLGIDVNGVRCLVVGGGRVGTRKVQILAKYGATVTVVSPEISKELQESVRRGELMWKQATYDPQDLGGVVLVIAATSEPELNLRIGRDAEDRRIFGCVASSGRDSRVIFPAIHVQGDITVAVHSGGRDCPRSRKVRDEIARMMCEKGSSWAKEESTS